MAAWSTGAGPAAEGLCLFDSLRFFANMLVAILSVCNIWYVTLNICMYYYLCVRAWEFAITLAMDKNASLFNMLCLCVCVCVCVCT